MVEWFIQIILILVVLHLIFSSKYSRKSGICWSYQRKESYSSDYDSDEESYEQSDTTYSTVDSNNHSYSESELTQSNNSIK